MARGTGLSSSLHVATLLTAGRLPSIMAVIERVDRSGGMPMDLLGQRLGTYQPVRLRGEGGYAQV